MIVLTIKQVVLGIEKPNPLLQLRLCLYLFICIIIVYLLLSVIA